MTEEEMMEMAIRLSRQEASEAEHRRMQEDDAVDKAIAESLFAKSQTPQADSQSLLAAPSPSRVAPPSPLGGIFSPRRKLSYHNHRETERGGAYGDSSKVDTLIGPDQRWKEGCNPLPQMPILSQSSSPSQGTPSVPLLTPEECCSSHGEHEVDAPPLRDSPAPCHTPLGSPVLRLTKLSLELVQSCQASGFLCCSQGESPPPVSQSPRGGSPTFPKSPVFSRTAWSGRPRGCGDTEPPGVSPGHRSPSQGLPSPRKVLGPGQRGRPVEDNGRGTDFIEDVEQDGLKHGDAGLSDVIKPSVPEEEQDFEEDLLLVETEPVQDFPSNMVLRLSDGEDEDDEDERPVQERLGPSFSPVFPQEDSLQRPPPHRSPPSANTPSSGEPQSASPLPSPPSPSSLGLPNAQSVQAPVCAGGSQGKTPPKKKFRGGDTPVSRACSDRPGPAGSGEASPQGGLLPVQPPPAREKVRAGTVLYHWGVPFCPRGQNPDEYTRVILSQLEVYEKSLKEAQRRLLRKAPWGGPVLPAPPPEKELSRKSRPKRCRAPRLEEEEVHSHSAPGEEEQQEVISEDEEQQKEVISEEEEEESPSLFRIPRPSTDPVDNRSPPTEGSPTAPCPPQEGGGEMTGEEEVTGVCPETPPSNDSTEELMQVSPAQPEEPLPLLPQPPSPEVELMELQMEEAVRVEEVSPARSLSPRMECPLCMQPFPLTHVEAHAAYCDGSVEPEAPRETELQVSGRRKGGRRSEVTHDGSSASGIRRAQREKCYVCQGMIPRKDYDKHVDDCIQQQSSNAGQGAGGLLSALDQTEHKDSGAHSGPAETSLTPRCRGLADFPDTDDSRGAGSSPVRTFTPISEAVGCLVDFRVQGLPKHRGGKRSRKVKR